MNFKAILIAVLLSITGMAWANGGNSIDTVDVKNIVPTQVEVTPINVQGSLDQFNVKIDSTDVADSNKLKQSYDGRS